MISRPAIVLAASILAFPSVRAELAVVATDNKLLLVDGVKQVQANPSPDTFVVLDLAGPAPHKLAEIPGVPASVNGPPLTAALSPDGTLALVTSCLKIDPKRPSEQIMDNRVSAVDLTDPAKPRVIARLESGLGPVGVSFNRQGTLALVANRGDGTVAVFAVSGHRVSSAGRLRVGTAESQLSHVAFAPDGEHAFVTRQGDNMITELAVNGTRVTLAGRDIHAGLGPYGMDVAASADYAVVANVGPGGGDEDTVSLIDLRNGPAHTVDTVTAGQTPEGIKLSPDGTLCAVIVENGSTRRRGTPFASDHGKLVLFRVDAKTLKLRHIAAAPVGRWPQGVAFSRDNRTIVVSSMVEKNLEVFAWDGSRLTNTGHAIPLNGGPVAIRTSDP